MFLFKGAGLEKKTFLAKVVGTFNKVKEKKIIRTQEHPGNTRETPMWHLYFIDMQYLVATADIW